MKTRRGKRSEAFWPSLVMKKWLNIKPPVHEFSEDEVDTETESEDEASPRKEAKQNKCRNQVCRTEGNQSIFARQTSGIPLRHRRQKSETLRVQYINTKDVRVMIGTWNVAGRTPDEDVEIDEWLCMNEPADMYILGFQEVVPLNAGNVLGAEDKKPISKWEAIIRRTLNKSSQSETKYKSFSAPPSPVLRTSSAFDVLAEAGSDPEVKTLSTEPVVSTEAETCNFKGRILNKVVSLEKQYRLNRLHGLDSESRLDWPERSLASSKPVLRRVSSSSALSGFDWMQKSLFMHTHDTNSAVSRLKRVHHSSGNLGLLWTENQEQPEELDTVCDVSETLFDEGGDSFSELDGSSSGYGINQENTKASSKYVRIVSKQMVGINVSVWVLRRLRRHINNLKVSPVGVGLMGYMGNKGSVSVSMSLFQTRLCFVCSHLTSGHKGGDYEKRNDDVYEILRRTRFSSVVKADQPHKIPSHDQIFWFGDLNYRLNLLEAEVRKLVVAKQWDELINSDQLCNELRDGRVFQGWKEGVIDFPPTYKYEFNSDRYVGEIPREGEKKRAPAWCDRILWFGKGVKQLFYKHADIRISDHRPVSSGFVIEVEVFDHRKLQRALYFANAAVHPGIFLDEEVD